MCGRYKVSTKAPQIIAAFDVAHIAPAYDESDADHTLKQRYNVAPTDTVPVVRAEKDDPTKRELVPMRWGLIPFWAQDMSIGVRMLNARAETLKSKPAFREPLEKRRCLVVSDGFYEWRTTTPAAPRADAIVVAAAADDAPKKQARAKKPKPEKQPYLFAFEDKRVFAYAGLWAKWKGPAGTVESCTIITGPPNALVEPFHDRMPVILDPAHDAERIAAWLDPTRSDVDMEVLTTPRDLPGFVCFAVDKRVGNVRNDEPAVAEPLPPA
jgi:putative SOS response-associated peptidase YedK